MTEILNWAFANPVLASMIGAFIVAFIFVTIDCITSFFWYGKLL